MMGPFQGFRSKTDVDQIFNELRDTKNIGKCCRARGCDQGSAVASFRVAMILLPSVVKASNPQQFRYL